MTVHHRRVDRDVGAMLLDDGDAFRGGDDADDADVFGAGGAQSVRGFEERELNGDRGVRASFEYWTPNLLSIVPGAEKIRLQVLAFADAAWLNQIGSDVCLVGQSSCRMGSLGVGLRAGIPDSQIRLDLARPMSAGNPTRKGDWKLHVLLQQSF